LVTLLPYNPSTSNSVVGQPEVTHGDEKDAEDRKMKTGAGRYALDRIKKQISKKIPLSCFAREPMKLLPDTAASQARF